MLLVDLLVALAPTHIGCFLNNSYHVNKFGVQSCIVVSSSLRNTTTQFLSCCKFFVYGDFFL